MILAAGRGERLRPLTDRTPKPLIKVGGRPLIVHHLERLAQAGFEEVVINICWLGEQIEQTLGDGSTFGLCLRYSPEPPGALETAGGIMQALPLLGSAPFAVISGDIFCDYPLAQLRARDLQETGHLVLVDNPSHHRDGDFSLRENGLLIAKPPAFTFSGIAVLHSSLFRHWPAGRLPLRTVFQRAINNEELTGELYRGRWSDVGTIARLRAIRRQIEA